MLPTHLVRVFSTLCLLPVLAILVLGLSLLMGCLDTKSHWASLIQEIPKSADTLVVQAQDLSGIGLSPDFAEPCHASSETWLSVISSSTGDMKKLFQMNNPQPDQTHIAALLGPITEKDSVAAYRYDFLLQQVIDKQTKSTEQSTCWALLEIRMSWVCRPGFGHQVFGIQPCDERVRRRG